MSRDNLSDIECKMVDQMNKENEEGSDNVFVDASICAILQHLIESADEHEIIGCLGLVTGLRLLETDRGLALTH